MGVESRLEEGSTDEGVNLLFLSVVAVLVLLVWWTCRRPRKKTRPRIHRSLVAKFPIV